MRDKLRDWADRVTGYRYQSPADSGILRLLAVPITIIVLLLLLLGWYWSAEPAVFDVEAATIERAMATEGELTTGSYTTATTIAAMEALLNKRGG